MDWLRSFLKATGKTEKDVKSVIASKSIGEVFKILVDHHHCFGNGSADPEEEDCIAYDVALHRIINLLLLAVLGLAILFLALYYTIISIQSIRSRISRSIRSTDISVALELTRYARERSGELAAQIFV